MAGVECSELLGSYCVLSTARAPPPLQTLFCTEKIRVIWALHSVSETSKVTNDFSHDASEN